MARMRRGYARRERRQSTTWIPTMESYQIVLPNDTTTVKKEVLGYVDLTQTGIIESEATVERIRGRVICVKTTTGVGQFIIAGRFIEKDLADAAASETPDLFDVSAVGDNFPLWLPFACVDNDATSQWNGHVVDVKSKRRIGKGEVLQLIANAKTINPIGPNENYFIGLNIRTLIRTD